MSETTLTVGTGSADSEAVRELLGDFGARVSRFRQECLSYLQGQMSLDGITRALSEASAEPERRFAVHGPGMSLDQLHRYGLLHKALDTMMEQIFSEEIQRNRLICARALENGEYFLVRVLGRSIESAIYMLHSKQRILTERERSLAAFEAEQRQLQVMVKVLKAFEQTLDAPAEPGPLRRVELALGIYVGFFADLPRNDLLSACDRRALQLSKQHFGSLQASPPSPLRDEHLARCWKHLTRLPHPEVLEPFYSQCRSLAHSKPEFAWLEVVAA